MQVLPLCQAAWQGLRHLPGQRQGVSLCCTLSIIISCINEVVLLACVRPPAHWLFGLQHKQRQGYHVTALDGAWQQQHSSLGANHMVDKAEAEIARHQGPGVGSVPAAQPAPVEGYGSIEDNIVPLHMTLDR